MTKTQINQAKLLAIALRQMAEITTIPSIGKTMYMDDVAINVATRMVKFMVQDCNIQDCNIQLDKNSKPCERTKWENAMDKLSYLAMLHMFLKTAEKELEKELDKRL